MSRLFSIRTVLSIAALFTAAMMSSPAWSQHGGGHGGGGHGGFGGGHGGFGGGHGGFGGGHGGYSGGHGGYSGGHSGYGGGHGGYIGGHGGYIGGHGGYIGGHGGYGGHGYGVHGGLHGYSDSGYGHYGYGHDYGHGYAGHGTGLYGHGGYLHGYGYHDYYPHSFYDHYPSYYDSYPYYGWYPSFSVSLYPWYGFYGANDQLDRVVVNRPVIADDHADHELASAPAEQSAVPTSATATAQGRQYQQQAESAFRAGRTDEALRLANHAFVEMPRDGKLLLFVSHTLLARGDYRGAAAAIHQAATLLDKGDWGYVVKNWKNYYRGRGYADAMDKLTEYVKKNPDEAYAHFLRAYHFGFLGREEFARKEMTKAIELESRDQLAVELLKLFGGNSPELALDDAAPDETKHDSEHDH